MKKSIEPKRSSYLVFLNKGEDPNKFREIMKSYRIRIDTEFYIAPIFSVRVSEQELESINILKEVEHTQLSSKQD